MFGRKSKILIDTETDPDVKVSGNFTEYYKLLENWLRYLQDILQQFKSKHLAMININCRRFSVHLWRFGIHYIIPYKSA